MTLRDLIPTHPVPVVVNILMVAQASGIADIYFRHMGHKLTLKVTGSQLHAELLFSATCGILMYMFRKKYAVRYTHILMTTVPLVIVTIIYLRMLYAS